MSTEELSLSDRDVRAVVRLLGELTQPSDATVGLRRRLMQELADLLEAPTWMWANLRVDGEACKPIVLSMMHGGFTEDQLAALLTSTENVAQLTPIDAAMTELATSSEHFTRSRDQLASDDQWYASPAVNRYLLDHGLDHILCSCTPINGGGMVSYQGFFRRVGQPPFTVRQRDILHVITAEVPWLHREHPPTPIEHAVDDLSPRLRSVLALLLEGRNRNEIAKLLSISPHTVKDHTAAIYRRFDVNSQAKLLHRFHVGDSHNRVVSA